MTPYTCPPVPPPAPLGEVRVIDADTVAMPLTVAQWYGARSSYADQLRGCLLWRDADLLRVTLALEDETATAEHWRRVARSRPSWGWVAGGAVVGAVATGLVVWQVHSISPAPNSSPGWAFAPRLFAWQAR